MEKKFASHYRDARVTSVRLNCLGGGAFRCKPVDMGDQLCCQWPTGVEKRRIRSTFGRRTPDQQADEQGWRSGPHTWYSDPPVGAAKQVSQPNTHAPTEKTAPRPHRYRYAADEVGVEVPADFFTTQHSGGPSVLSVFPGATHTTERCGSNWKWCAVCPPPEPTASRWPPAGPAPTPLRGAFSGPYRLYWRHGQ